MINFNGSLTHLPGQAWEHEKCLTWTKIPPRHGQAHGGHPG